MPTPFWKHPAHRIPTLGLYRVLLKSTFSLPHNCVHQPGPRRIPIQDKGVGPPGSSNPLPRLQRSYLFQMIRDEFRSNRYCTSPRITAGYLREAEETLKKLRRARDGDQEIRKELKDLVHGRSGRLKEVIDHLSDLINWDPKSTTQRDRYKRLKRAQEQVWDVRTQTSIERDQHPFYKITLHPSLFTFPPELDYYPPHKYPRQLKNKRGLFKNSGGVFLTEVKTSEGSKFPRIRGGSQPEWISMMLKGRVQASVRRVNEWKQLEELQRMMQIEEQFTKQLGVDDTGYVEGIGKRLKEVQEDHARRKRDANERNGLEVGNLDDDV
ncbi:hypothetical protein EC957_008404 [Mortierella hygrophila]|uniref:Uncharacterized protein n=1 Tax=Mortierella hygrophila TaxID=979708 RepID=A0A9P6EXL4_9FUNG|nr:hypothetical protein EC957_008404 [Mortierella hygrophila]